MQSGLHLTKIDVDKDEAFAACSKKASQITSEDWQSQLVSKYQNLKHVSHDNLPGLWDSLEFELAIQKILNIADCTLPFAGIVLGSPSSLKTVGMNYSESGIMYSILTVSVPNQLYRIAPPSRRKKFPKIDMLPKIKK